MKIVLLRHGKPNIDTSQKLSASEFRRWVNDYDRAGLDKGHYPPKGAVEISEACSFVVSSNLPRSLESAKALNIDEIDLVSPEFRECDVPYADLSFPKLSALTWTILFRTLQFLGYSPDCESYSEIKNRSKRCVAQLNEFAAVHQSVLLIGHGTLMWFIHKRLLRMGWTGPTDPVKAHWEFGIYRK